MIEKLRKYVNLDRLGARIPVPADAVTALSLAVALVGVYLTWVGWPAWPFIAVVGALDVMDGAIARSRGTAGRPGALLDSTLDRYTDALILLYFYRSAPHLLIYLALLGTFLISYVRARAESLGLSMRGVGFMERAERILYLSPHRSWGCSSRGPWPLPCICTPRWSTRRRPTDSSPHIWRSSADAVPAPRARRRKPF